MKNRDIILIILVAILSSVEIEALAEENGTLTLGMSAAISGPAQELGINMRKGVETYFKKNQRSGWNKRERNTPGSGMNK